MKGVKNAAAGDRLLDAALRPENVAARRAHLRDPLIAPLTDWVNSVRERLTPCQAASVCDFDPWLGGIHSTVLLLLQDPSSTAARTGFISCDNNDNTAYQMALALGEVRLERDIRLHWNAYPFWLKNPAFPTSPRKVKVQCAQFLAELVELLPLLAVVVTVGISARDSWEQLRNNQARLTGIPTFSIPHPAYGGWGKRIPNGALGGDYARQQLTRAREATCAY